MPHGPANRTRRGAPWLAFLAALLWIAGLQQYYRRFAGEGVYFHAWTSEYMMQTVSAADLRAEPLRSLYYNHIQPPVLDAIRAAIAQLLPRADGPSLVRGVDIGLHVAWALVYAATAALVFAWLRRTSGAIAAAVGCGAFLLLPGPIFYATFLDSTLLSAMLFLWFLFEMWLLGRRQGAWWRLALAGALLFLTRSVFQWPFLLVAVGACALSSVPWKHTVRFALALGVVMGLFVYKQQRLFGLTITSSFGPDSFCKGLSQHCQGTTLVPIPPLTSPANARALRHTTKLNGEYNYNQIAFLRRSFSQMEEYKALVRRLTPARVIEVLRVNLGFYLRPTSRHSAHALVDRLPWRAVPEWLMSGWPLVLLLLGATVLFLREPGDFRPLHERAIVGLGLSLPVLYVVAVSVAFESGENMRYRYFVEPVTFVFLFSQAAALARPRKPRGGEMLRAAPD